MRIGSTNRVIASLLSALIRIKDGVISGAPIGKRSRRAGALREMADGL